MERDIHHEQEEIKQAIARLSVALGIISGGGDPDKLCDKPYCTSVEMAFRIPL